MIETMIVVFVIGYLLIATEHLLEINKATFALLMGGVLWTMFAFTGMVDNIDAVLVEHLGDTCEILVFLIGAMIIVELIDKYKGFNFVTHVIHSHNKKKLLFMMSVITFFMSAVLDNMTTTIVMIMLTITLTTLITTLIITLIITLISLTITLITILIITLITSLTITLITTSITLTILTMILIL